MYARLPAETLRDALAPVNALVNEVIFRPTPDALILHGSRGDRTASVTVTLPSTIFDTYDPSDHALGLNVQRPFGLLSHFSPTSRLTITAPPRTERFKLTMEETSSTYRSPPINPSTIHQHSQDTLDRRPTAIFALPSDSALLQHSLAAASLCGETVTIETQQSAPEIRFASTGLTDDMYSLFTRDELRAYYGEPATATYDVSKLSTMYNALRVRTEQLHFTIDPDTTLFLTATHTDTEMTTRYTLASHDSTG